MEIEATLTKLPFWDNLSEQEKTLTKCGATHRTYEKGVYIFDYSDSCMSGARSAQATSVLKSMGYTNVTDIGGINSYRGKVVE